MSLGYIGEPLPKEWCSPLLTDLATPKQWKTIATKELLSAGYTVYGANGKIGYFDQYTHEHPTIMITCRGATCGNLHISEPFSYINGNAMALDGQPTELVGLKFLYFALKARGLDDTISGSAQPQITGKGLAEVRLPLPPLAEQKVIADKLDTLLAQVENTKARLERIPQILKRFRQSVLAAAVSGRLTEEWMENCAAPAWSEVQLDTICKSISDGDHQAPPRAENGIPFLVISNVTSGRIDFKNVSRWVPMDYYERLKDIRKPEKNDLLYTVTGSFGIPAIVDTDQPFCFQRHIAIIKPNHATVSVDFLALYLRSPQAFHHSESVATGTAQKTVSLKNLRSFPISLPSMEEQAEIVRRVKQLFAHADRVEQQVNGALVRVNNLTQSILAKAFRGELTEQWRKHNPKLISGNNSAEALLERIEAERDQKNKQPRKRRASKEEKVVKKMDKKIGVVEALKRIGEPLSGQQLLVAAGYSADSSTEDLELFFLDLRDALTVQQRVVKLYRDRDGQDWFALPEMNKQMSREDR